VSIEPTNAVKRSKPENNRHMIFSADKPYNDLPLMPPGKDVETKTILKQCIAPKSALAGLKQAGGQSPLSFSDNFCIT